MLALYQQNILSIMRFKHVIFLIIKDNFPLWITITSHTNSYLYNVLLARARSTTLTESTISYGIY